MTLQDFTTHWQAQPFRAFRIHAGRTTADVNHPLAVALSPQLDVLVAGSSEATRIALDDITRCEAIGQPRSIAEAIGAVPPALLAAHAQQLAAALEAGAPGRRTPKRVAKRDRGTLRCVTTRTPEGVLLVHGTLAGEEGRPLFDISGTRWNLHGAEPFENGTSLYVHHLDHPSSEQRIIVWPPDTGTFDTFAEAKPLAALRRELERRDRRLAAKPARPAEPRAAYFRQILPAYRTVEADARAMAFGPDRGESDFSRYELHLLPNRAAPGRAVKCPWLVDVLSEETLFDLRDTSWDAVVTRGPRSLTLRLQAAGHGKATLTLVIDPQRRLAGIGDSGAWHPLGFVERHLRNFALHEAWEPLTIALNAGPVKLRQPDLVVPLAQGFRAEMWAGERHHPLPFLQPRFLDPRARPLLDFRASAWSAVLTPHRSKALVTLRFVSHEAKRRFAPPALDLQLDLVTHRVTCDGLEGWTTLGMLQAMVRQVRGITWLAEELRTLLAKGRALPGA